MTVILIARDMADGRRWRESQPWPPARLVIVTPRSPRAARGVTAHAALITEAAERLPAETLEKLRAETFPSCLVAGR